MGSMQFNRGQYWEIFVESKIEVRRLDEVKNNFHLLMAYPSQVMLHTSHFYFYHENGKSTQYW